MPELPEVEIARRALAAWLDGVTITSASASELAAAGATRGSADASVGGGLLRGASRAGFARALKGRAVQSVARRGKWLRVEVDDGRRLFSHLGMTGRWVRRTVDDAPLRAEHVRLDVARGGETWSVRYVDPRRFGRVVLAEHDIAAWTELGVDPLLDGLDGPALARALGTRRGTVKELLMDQTVVAGVGNIQATEALWAARIDPRAPVALLSAADLGRVARAVQASIARTLAMSGGEEVAYLQEGKIENPFRVYGREGEPCPRCRTALEKTTLGGRTTTYCPICQAPHVRENLGKISPSARDRAKPGAKRTARFARRPG